MSTDITKARGFNVSGTGVNLNTGKHLILPQVNEAATPTLSFGDGDSGLYEASDDTISIATAGVRIIGMGAAGIYTIVGGSTIGAIVATVTATATVPSLIPLQSDSDTGLGTAGADALSLIAGGVEAMRLTEAAGAIAANIPGILTVGVPASIQQSITIKGSNVGTSLWTAAHYAANLVLHNLNGGANSFGSISFMDAGENSVAGISGIFVSDANNQGEIAFWTRNNTGFQEVLRLNMNGNVGIGTTTPNANALLDIASTTKAFMPPRMTSVQKAAIASPTAGMMVYDSTLNKLCVYGAAGWETITSA